jgi:CRISPR-associated protein Cmr2
MLIYTAISFAPVQGFIEKSRKLRDLFGASLILSHLSQKLAIAANQRPELEVISPALINMQEGMPNRILIEGLFERNNVEKVLIEAWDDILKTCRIWIETNVPSDDRYHWDAEWQRWKQYTWEIFWGLGNDPSEAMRDLERRKLKRDWIGINWTGESSSLTGTDAIAWHKLGKETSNPGCALTAD